VADNAECTSSVYFFMFKIANRVAHRCGSLIFVFSVKIIPF
jgi:hypothetical protein